MSTAEKDALYMRRALELARHGLLDAAPNPMVGCVITTPDGSHILGEGWHRRCGQGHAEVNAVAAVKAAGAAHRLRGATVYVTLEPCSHYGKTPPCAKLLSECGVGRVVVGARDPNAKVDGRGMAMLREAGVTVEMIADEAVARQCRELNPKFVTAFTSPRPYVTLKWACSADGFMDRKRTPQEPPQLFSTPLSTAEVHRLRATHDAILAGPRTLAMDRPALTVRAWAGRSPRRAELQGHPEIGPLLESLRAEGVTSLLVEGGPTLLRSFIAAGLWDAARVEVSPMYLGSQGAAPAPTLPFPPAQTRCIRGNTILTYLNPHLPPATEG